MEDRQDVKHLVLTSEVDPCRCLRRVGENIPVGEDDALGRAFRARGEQYDGGCVGADGCQRSGIVDGSTQFLRQRDASPDVFEIDELETRSERPNEFVPSSLLDEPPRGHDRFHFGGFASREDIDRARREVDERWDPTARHEAKDRRSRAVGVGQQHPDGFAFHRESAELPGQHTRADEQPLIGESPTQRILDGDSF
jgi:hypothetical protein